MQIQPWWATGFLLAAVASCGPSQAPSVAPAPQGKTPKRTKPASAPAEPMVHVGFKASTTDRCEKNPDGSYKDAVAKPYEGLLKNARCGDQAFFTMSSLAKTLGMQCVDCHVQDPNDPKREIYTQQTDMMRTANWMLEQYIDGLQRTDGSAAECKDCHTGADGKGLAKALGVPRDQGRTMKFMSTVMVGKFNAAGGTELACKTCHGADAPGDGWKAQVIPFSRTSSTE